MELFVLSIFLFRHIAKLEFIWEINDTGLQKSIESNQYQDHHNLSQKNVDHHSIHLPLRKTICQEKTKNNLGCGWMLITQR